MNMLQVYHSECTKISFLAHQNIEFNLSALEKEFRSKNLYGLIQGSFLIPVFRAESENVPNFDILGGDEEGGNEKKSEDINRKIVQSARKDPVIVQHLLDLFTDLIENRMFDDALETKLEHLKLRGK